MDETLREGQWPLGVFRAVDSRGPHCRFWGARSNFGKITLRFSGHPVRAETSLRLPVRGSAARRNAG